MPKSASDSPSLAPSRKLDRDMQMPPETQVVIDFDDNRGASALVGPYGQNLALIERRLGVVVDSRGNHISIADPATAATLRGACWKRCMRKRPKGTTSLKVTSRAQSAPS